MASWLHYKMTLDCTKNIHNIKKQLALLNKKSIKSTVSTLVFKLSKKIQKLKKKEQFRPR